MMRPPGIFITLEGPEGAGKSFHSSRLAEKLESMGWDTVRTREPGGTPAAETMRSIALETALPPRAELLLFLSARADHVESVIRPALSRGAAVVCDRFIDSTAAYQGYGLGLDLMKIRELNDYATDHLSPDLTLVLDVPPEVGFARRGEARRDQIERRRDDFHRRLREGFLEEAKRFPDRIRVIDATREPDETFRRVWTAVESLLIERNLR